MIISDNSLFLSCGCIFKVSQKTVVVSQPLFNGNHVRLKIIIKRADMSDFSTRLLGKHSREDVVSHREFDK